jgi:FixJ family two-component response regulator
MRRSGEIPSIYVIDDDDAVRDSLAALLEPEGFAISLYSSGDEFLADLGEKPSGNCSPSCLLLDLNMPGKGGMELMAILAERDYSLPVVVMTGNIDERTKTQALKSGAVGFLEKPVDADHLIDVLRNALVH